MKPTLTIGHLPIIDHLILGVAEKNDGGYFKSFSLQRKLSYNWEPIVEDLANGRLDGAFILFPLALDLFRKGEKIKIALLGQREGQVLVVSNDVKSLKELEGKTMQVPNKYSVHNILQFKLLQQAGVDAARVNYRIGFDDVREFPELLQKGETQAFITAEPWGTVAQRMGAGHIINTSYDVFTHHVCCVLVLRDEVIEKQPQACQEFIDSLVKAGMFISAYPRHAAEIGEEFMELPKNVTLEALTHTQGHVLFWDLLPRLEDFSDLQNIAVNEMRLWDDVIDLHPLVYDTFAQRAYRDWMIDTRREVKDRGGKRTLPGNFAEAAAQLNEWMPEARTVVGVKKVLPGEKYPKTIEKSGKSELAAADFVEALSRDTCIMLPNREDKGIAFLQPSPGADPERVIIEADEASHRRIMRALGFGNKAVGAPHFDETSLLQFVDCGERAILKLSGKHYLSLSVTEFRFLPLLLHYYQ